MPTDRIARTRITYGVGPDRTAELWTPHAPVPASGWPVAVLVHGSAWAWARTWLADEQARQ